MQPTPLRVKQDQGDFGSRMQQKGFPDLSVAARLMGRALGRTQPVNDTRSSTFVVSQAARARSRTIHQIERGMKVGSARRGLVNRRGTRTHASAGGTRREKVNYSRRALVMHTNLGGVCQVRWSASCSHARLSILKCHAPTSACSRRRCAAARSGRFWQPDALERCLVLSVRRS